MGTQEHANRVDFPRFTVVVDGTAYARVAVANLRDLCSATPSYEEAVEAFARAVVTGEPLRIIDERGLWHNLSGDMSVTWVWLPGADRPLAAGRCGDEFCRCEDCDEERAEWIGTVDAARELGVSVAR